MIQAPEQQIVKFQHLKEPKNLAAGWKLTSAGPAGRGAFVRESRDKESKQDTPAHNPLRSPAAAFARPGLILGEQVMPRVFPAGCAERSRSDRAAPCHNSRCPHRGCCRRTLPDESPRCGPPPGRDHTLCAASWGVWGGKSRTEHVLGEAEASVKAQVSASLYANDVRLLKNSRDTKKTSGDAP